MEDPECPWLGKIPITPVMDTQLDQIIIKDILMPLRENLLSELRTRMERSHKEDWFETFLVTFILCTNTELLLRHSRNNAKLYGAKVNNPFLLHPLKHSLTVFSSIATMTWN